MSTTGIAALRRAKEILGTEVAVAKIVGVDQPTVNYALRKRKAVPAEWCLKLEEATGGKITRHDLRPDLYPEDERAN